MAYATKAVIKSGQYSSLHVESPDSASVTEQRERRNGSGVSDAPKDTETQAPAKRNTQRCSHRLNSLVTGPESKAISRVSNGTAPARPRKNRVSDKHLGRLKGMLSLPIDVISEIVKHLRPDDLLRLSRASHQLRDFFMSKRSRPIWRTCIKSIGMPPCPEDLCEPQYANLYFEKECHACGFDGVGSETLHLRIRLCQGCTKLNVLTGKALAEGVFGTEVSKNYEIYTLLPWKNILDWDLESLSVVNSKIRSRRFLKFDFINVIGAYLATEAGSKERKDFVEERHRIVRENVKNVLGIFAWRYKERFARFDSERKTGDLRKAQIFDRLHALGYSYDEMNSMTNFPLSTPSLYDEAREIKKLWRQLIEEKKKVTDRTWNLLGSRLTELIVRRRLVDRKEAIESKRRKRRAELFSYFEGYVMGHDLHEDDEMTFTFLDLCEVPEVMGMIKQDECSLEITPDRWLAIERKLPELIENHFLEVKRDCSVSLLSVRQQVPTVKNSASPSDPPSTSSEDDIDVVSRADAFFVTQDSSGRLSTFSDILSAIRVNVLESNLLRFHAWNSKWYQADTFVVRAANALLSSLGLPETTSMVGMEILGESLVCQQCAPALRERMTWRRLVWHVSREAQHYRLLLGYADQYDIPLRESHKIKAPEETLVTIDPNHPGPPADTFTPVIKSPNDTDPTEPCPWCRRCGLHKRFMYNEQLAAHLQSHHGIDNDNL